MKRRPWRRFFDRYGEPRLDYTLARPKRNPGTVRDALANIIRAQDAARVDHYYMAEHMFVLTYEVWR